MATGSLPQDGQDLGSLLEFVDRAIAPYPTGNGHPAFFAWINSPPSPAGVIAELLATAVNATGGMGEHALMDLERGVLRDLASLAGLAPTAGGVLTSGGSMANLLCLGAARTWFLRQQDATDGPAYDQAHARLVAYHSDQADPVVVRTSDFKTNEYAKLLGGRPFEPVEANPMIGWRGASRYYSDGYREGFALECQALRRVREEMGLTNVIVMIPFCRTLEEADKVLEVMAAAGLRRGENGLKVYVMAEIPANILLAQDFAERFDGFSIGSNDLTQLTLGVDCDSEALAHVFDENDPAVTDLIRILLPRVQTLGRPVGLCGQRPSDDPAYAAFLVRAGIDSISVAPDSFAAVKQHVAAAEEERYGEDRMAPVGIRPAQADQPSGA
ncbi:putative PEP-binding protein [Streptomyces avidinii]|uniref:putative PEP-binding protein n=1 Tax=Streptomyces avidinii TaxID=1895 RepID=UPI0037B9EA64